MEAVTWAWEHSRARGTARLILLAIATEADDREHKAAASMSFLEKRANAQRPTVVAAVRDLIRLGELEVVPGETGRYGSAVYRMPMRANGTAPGSRRAYRKKPVTQASRRALAVRYGCPPGGSVMAPCGACGKPVRITWHALADGHPGARVSFEHEIDHVTAEYRGGAGTPDNLQLLCRPCNRDKGAGV